MLHCFRSLWPELIQQLLWSKQSCPAAQENRANMPSSGWQNGCRWDMPPALCTRIAWIFYRNPRAFSSCDRLQVRTPTRGHLADLQRVKCTSIDSQQSALRRGLKASRFSPRDAKLARYVLWPCVCPSVRPLQAGVLSKRPNIGPRNQRLGNISWIHI